MDLPSPSGFGARAPFGFAGVFPGSLSGDRGHFEDVIAPWRHIEVESGQQQIVAIAKALVQDVLDAPWLAQNLENLALHLAAAILLFAAGWGPAPAAAPLTPSDVTGEGGRETWPWGSGPESPAPR